MNMNISQKELPITRLNNAYEARNAVTSLYLTTICMLSALIVAACLAIFSESQVGFWIGLVATVIFGILLILSVLDLINKVNKLSEIAIQNAWDFGTEFGEKNMVEFALKLEQLGDPVSRRRQPNLAQRPPRDDGLS